LSQNPTLFAGYDLLIVFGGGVLFGPPCRWTMKRR